MSTILEALKKATKEIPAEAAGTEKSHAVPEPELKKPEARVPDLNAPRLSRSAVISLAIIVFGGSLLFFLLKDRDVPITKDIEPRAQPTNMALNEKSAVPAEGYAPVNIFKIKISNPRLELSGIVSGIGKPTAIINNKIVEEGASISGAKVVKIYSDKVELRNEASGEIFTLKVY